MDHDFQIHPYLVSVADMEEFEDEAELAADQLNAMLHMAATEANNREWSEQQAIELVEELCFIWFREPSLTELESDEMEDYVANMARRMEQQRDDDTFDNE